MRLPIPPPGLCNLGPFCFSVDFPQPRQIKRRVFGLCLFATGSSCYAVDVLVEEGTLEVTTMSAL